MTKWSTIWNLAIKFFFLWYLACWWKGSGEDTKFWTARWLHGSTVADLAPNLIQIIPKSAKRQLTVSQTLNTRKWVADIPDALTVQVIIKCLKLWELVDDFTFQPSTIDQHTWKLTHSGLYIYTSKSAYNSFFLGSIEFTPWKRIWKSWAPLQCKFLWLAMKNRCWTAYHLSRHRQTHPSVCSLCDQEEESIQHTLVSCVFSREIWTKILLFVRFPSSAV